MKKNIKTVLTKPAEITTKDKSNPAQTQTTKTHDLHTTKTQYDLWSEWNATPTRPRLYVRVCCTYTHQKKKNV